MILMLFLASGSVWRKFNGIDLDLELCFEFFFLSKMEVYGFFVLEGKNWDLQSLK
jgi:hypothetical protein